MMKPILRASFFAIAIALQLTGVPSLYADLNHYVPAEDPRQPDPCPPNEDDDCSENPDGSPEQGDQGCESNEAGDPFDLHSGEFTLDRIYLSQRGGATNLRLKLHYSTYLGVHTAAGYGWTHNYNMRLRETSQGRLVMVNHHGALIYFESSGANEYESTNIWNVTVKFANGLYTMRHADGPKYIFDADGLLRTIEYTNGATLELSYAPDGQTDQKHAVISTPRNSNLITPTTVVRDYRVHKVVEKLANGQATGRYLEFTYDANGLLDLVEDQAGESVGFGHDADGYGNLEVIVGPDNTLSNYSYYMNVGGGHQYRGFMETFSRQGCSNCTIRKNEYISSGVYAGWLKRQVQGEHEEGEDISVTYQTVGNGHVVNLTHKVKVLNPDGVSTTELGTWSEKVEYITDVYDSRRVKRRTHFRNTSYDAGRPEGDGDYYLEYTYYGEDANDENLDGAYLAKVKTKRDYNGVVSHYKYNADGLVVQTRQEVSASVDLVLDFEYDADQHLIKETLYQTDRPTEQFITENVYYSGTDLVQYKKQHRGNNSYNITEYIYYPDTHATEGLLKEEKVYVDANLLGSTHYEYTTSADAPQPIGLLKRSYDGLDANREVSYVYNARGLPVLMTEANGCYTERDFDARGRVTESRKKSAAGVLLRKQIREFSGDNLIKVHSGNDVEGYRIVKYDYDSLNRRIKESRYNSTTATYELVSETFFASDSRVVEETNALGQTVEYKYYDNFLPWVSESHTPWKLENNQIQISVNKNWYDSLGRVYLVRDAIGHFDRYEFDGLGRVITHYEANGNPDERITRRQYNALSKVVSESISKMVDGSEVTVGTTYYYYDELGRVVGVNWNPDNDDKTGDFVHPRKLAYNDSAFSKSLTDANGHTTTVISDAYGNVIRRQFPDRNDFLLARPNDGNDEVFVYNSYDQLIRKTDGRGIHVYFKYDEYGRMTHTSVETMNDWSATQWWTDPANVVAEIDKYSAWGEVLEVYNVDRIKSTSVFDDFGRLLYQTRSGSPIVSYEYSAIDKVLKENYPAITGSDPQPASSVEFIYDQANGNLLREVISREGHSTKYTYDILGRKRTVTTSLNQSTGKYKNLEYDALGRLKLSQDEEGNTTAFKYDVLGNTVKIYHPNHPFINDEIDPNSSVGVEEFVYNEYNLLEQRSGFGVKPVHYDYDAVGNRIALTDNKNQATGTAMFSGGTTTGWEYDSRGRVSRKLYDYSDQGNYHSYYEYTYNANGDLASRRDAKGQIINYEYEQGRNLLSKVDYPSDVDHTFSYDKAGRMTTLVDSTGTTTSSYDSLGRISEIAYSSVGHSIHYKYDTWSRIYERRVRATGTAEGHASEWLTGYQFDDTGRLEHIYDHRVSASSPFVYSWHASASLVTRVTFPTGARQDKAYDDMGRLEEISAFDQSNQAVNYYTYAYNEFNQVDSIDDLAGNTLDLGYDNKHQLTSAKKTDTNAVVVNNYDFTFDYDEIGNRTLKGIAGVITNYYPNALNQYEGIGGTPGSYTVTPTYNNNGSLTANERMQLDWNEEGLMTSCGDLVQGTQSVMSYDGVGRKIEQIDYDAVSGGAEVARTRYLYEGSLCLASFVQDGQGGWMIETSNTWGRDLSASGTQLGGAGGLLARTTSTGSHYFTYDASGNVVDVLDAAGTVSAHYEYSPFGEVISQTGSYAAENTYRFATKPVNTHAGNLVDFGLRHFDPKVGKWVSRDPLAHLRPATLMAALSRTYNGGAETLPEGPNMFNYGKNSPFSEVDVRGELGWVIAGAVAGAVVGGVIAHANGGDWKEGAAKGAVIGGLMFLNPASAVGAFAAGAALGGTIEAINGGDAGDVASAAVSTGVAALLFRKTGVPTTFAGWAAIGAAQGFIQGFLDSLGDEILDLLNGDCFDWEKPFLDGLEGAAWGAALGGVFRVAQKAAGSRFGQFLARGARSLGNRLRSAAGAANRGVRNAFGNVIRRSNSKGLGRQNREYMRYRQQGYSANQSRYLTQPYPNSGMGHHFIPRRFKKSRGGIVPDRIVESAPNIMGKGMSRGRFYERHYLGDSSFHGTRFPKSVGGGSWSGRASGLTKPNAPLRVWNASPNWLRNSAVGTGGAAVVWGGYTLFDDE